MWVPMLKKMFAFNFNSFFDKLSLNEFAGVLACKLKPFSTSLHVTKALLGWQLIGSKSIRKVCVQVQTTCICDLFA